MSLLIKRREIIEKYKDSIIYSVKLSDISQYIIPIGIFDENDCYELLSLPKERQMVKCIEKISESLSYPSNNFIWTNFMIGLKKVAPSLAMKIELELFFKRNFARVESLKSRNETGYGASGSRRARIEQNDSYISYPTNFRHLVHIGYMPGEGFRKYIHPDFELLFGKSDLFENTTDNEASIKFFKTFFQDHESDIDIMDEINKFYVERLIE